MIRLALVTLLLTAAPVAAQQTVDVRLPDPRPLPGAAALTVTDAFDLRADTALGTARTGLTNRRRPLALVGGAVPAVAAHLRALAPPSDDARPLVVGVETLHLSEQATAMTEYARAEVGLRFFVASGDSLAEVGGAVALAERSGIDVTRYHDDTLAEALRTALAEFAASDWRSVSLAFVPRSEVRGGTLTDVTASGAANEAAGATPPLTARAERSVRTFVTGGAVVGVEGAGGRLVVGTRREGPGAWSFPLSLEVQVLRVANESRGLEATFASYGSTVQAARRLGRSPLAAQFGLLATGGTERVNDSESYFIFGGRLGAELVLLPPESGLTASIGVYGSRLFGSALYPSDVGATATVGVQF